MSARRALKKRRSVLSYVGMGVSIGLLGLVVLLGLAVVVVPAVTGSTPLTVLTQSMEPTFPTGTLVVVKPIDAADIRIGDPITYQIESGKPEVVTHRVLSITSTNVGGLSFITKGDNNDAPDENPVVPDQVRGKVWYSVPYIGYVNTVVGGSDKSWIVPVVAVALFLYAGWMFASGFATRRRRIQRSARAEREQLAAAERSTIPLP